MTVTSPQVALAETRSAPAIDPARLPRYTALAQTMHWLTALLAFAILPIAWVMQSMDRGPDREVLVSIHRSIGITILALVAIRILWRAWHAAPQSIGGHGALLERVAQLSHYLLYAIFIVMPVSGYILSSAGGHEISFFGLFELPQLPTNRPLAHAASFVHNSCAYAVYALVGLHIAATVWHIAVFRDGTLDRMLPAQGTTRGG